MYTIPEFTVWCVDCGFKATMKMSRKSTQCDEWYMDVGRYQWSAWANDATLDTDFRCPGCSVRFRENERRLREELHRRVSDAK